MYQRQILLNKTFDDAKLHICEMIFFDKILYEFKINNSLKKFLAKNLAQNIEISGAFLKKIYLCFIHIHGMICANNLIKSDRAGYKHVGTAE